MDNKNNIQYKPFRMVNPDGGAQWFGAIVLILLVGLFGWLSYKWLDDEPSKSNTNEVVESIPDKTPSAYIHAQEFVKQALKSPSTAEFPLTASTQEVEPNRFISQGYVDAQNGFGAMIRNQFVVTLRYTGSESYEALRNSANWKLEELILDNQVIYPAQ